MTEVVSRGEFDMLKSAVGENARRLDNIDSVGTRGVGIVHVQLTDLAKDIAQVATRLDQHERDHEQEARDRRTSRRWLIGTAIALLAAVEGPIIYLISVVHR